MWHIVETTVLFQFRKKRLLQRFSGLWHFSQVMMFEEYTFIWKFSILLLNQALCSEFAQLYDAKAIKLGVVVKDSSNRIFDESFGCSVLKLYYTIFTSHVQTCLSTSPIILLLNTKLVGDNQLQCRIVMFSRAGTPRDLNYRGRRLTRFTRNNFCCCYSGIWPFLVCLIVNVLTESAAVVVVVTHPLRQC